MLIELNNQIINDAIDIYLPDTPLNIEYNKYQKKLED